MARTLLVLTLRTFLLDFIFALYLTGMGQEPDRVHQLGANDRYLQNIQGGRKNNQTDIQKHPSSLAVLAEMFKKLAGFCSFH